MLYQRGTIQSHQQWADAVDDQSYSWEAFLPYFHKSVNYTAPDTHLRAPNASVPQPSPEAYQSESGPLHVTHSNWAQPWASWAQRGFRDIGIPDIDDFSSGNLLGSQYCPSAGFVRRWAALHVKCIIFALPFLSPLLCLSCHNPLYTGIAANFDERHV